jgi:hypothetical protein
MVDFNIIDTVGITEVDLAPFPGGSPTVPAGRNRKIYLMVLSNLTTGAGAGPVILTLRIYRDTTLERESSFQIPTSATVTVVSRRTEPILIVPPGRTLKAIASATSVQVLMAGYDE